MKKALCAIIASAMLLPALVAVSYAEPVQYKGYTIPDVVLDNKEVITYFNYVLNDTATKWKCQEITLREAMEQDVMQNNESATHPFPNEPYENYIAHCKEKYPELFEVSQAPIDPEEATVVYPSADKEYKTGCITVILKAKCSRSKSEDAFTAEDFPELALTNVTAYSGWLLEGRDLNGCLRKKDLSIYRQELKLEYSPELGITIEEALDRIAQNPMVLEARPVEKEAIVYWVTDDDDLIDMRHDIIIAGDVNGDFRVNSKDIIAVMKHISGVLELSDRDKPFADVNGDGNINAKDIIEIMRLMLVTWA